MTVIVDKPYRFVPPHRGNWWPSFIQRFRLVDFYLARHDGVVDYECRHLERVKKTIDAGHAILLTPNHCRYADPLVLGWPARQLRFHVFAMASWHLFAKSRFDAFAIHKMGGFSIFREGTDRQSLETAIDILVDAARPLILFPEGTTNRTNDVLQPLLDGVAFIARTAAKRRAKQNGGRVVVHPVAIKYLFMGDIQQWGDQAVSKLESAIGWRPMPDQPLLDRIRRLAEAMMSIHEVRYLGKTDHQSLPQRRDKLVQHLLASAESQHELAADPNLGPLGRVRRLRSTLSNELLKCKDANQLQNIYHAIDSVELSQQLYSYPDRYLFQFPTTDTQILETVERLQEGLLGKPDHPGPLKAVIEFGEPIEVPCDRAPRGETDPLMLSIQSQLTTMLDALSLEANLIELTLTQSN
ncbi:MAG TPA: 1-acyl-sn-glycerol-3-phosphate acyltransferase [Planctomycetaceae bacterium]|nr:1-acyl-sn-glycerol-3-phosphate acyltransferase [Planctomycetaceae bacterium]